MLEALGNDDARVDNYARFALGLLTVEQVAALHEVAPEQVLTDMTTLDMATRVDRRAAELECDGSAAKMRARSLLGEALRQLSDTVDRGECAPSFLLRLTEVIGKLAHEPKDEKKEPTGPTFQINIDLGGGSSVSLKGADPLTLDAATGELIASNFAPGRHA